MNVAVLHSRYLALRVDKDVVDVESPIIGNAAICEVERCLHASRRNSHDSCDIIYRVNSSVDSAVAALYIPCTLNVCCFLEELLVSRSAVEDNSVKRNACVLKSLEICIEVAEHVRSCESCCLDRCRCSYSLRVELRVCVAVELGDSLSLLEAALDVRYCEHLVCLINVHRINSELDVTIVIEVLCLIVVGVGASVEAEGASAVVLVARNCKLRNLDVLCACYLDVKV